MALSPQTDAVLDGIAVALRADPELTHELRAELSAHVAAGVAERIADGEDPAAAEAAAVTALGRADDLSAELALAYARRIRRRRVARLMVWCLLIPAALLASVLGLAHMQSRTVQVAKAFRSLADAYPGRTDSALWSRVDVPDWGSVPDVMMHELDAASRFVFEGDPTRATPAERQRSIWESAPRNRVFFGNYVSSLLAEPEAVSDAAVLSTALDTGAALDPENSRYDYLKAYLLSRNAVHVQDLGVPGARKSRVTILDREQLDRAMAALLAGHARPKYRRYALEMLRWRLAVLPDADRIEDLAARTDYVAGQVQPDGQVLKRLGVIAAHYGTTLIHEGRPREALRVLDSWRDFATKLNADAFSFVDLGTVGQIARNGSDLAANALAELGMRDLALRHRSDAQRIRDLLDAEAAVSQEVEHRFYADVQRSGSLYARLVTPRVGVPPFPTAGSGMAGDPLTIQHTGSVVPAAARTFDADTLTGLRWAEHLFLEQMAAVVLIAALVMATLIALLVGAIGALRRNAPLAAVLCAWPSYVKTLGYGLVLPLTVYAIYSRFVPTADRGFGVGYYGSRFAYELLLLALGVSAACIAVAAYHVRARMRDLGLAPMRPVHPLRMGIWLALYAVLWGIGIGTDATGLMPGDLVVRIAMLIAALILADGLGLLLRALAPRRFAVTAPCALSVAPLLALAALTVACAVFPLLRSEEARYMQSEDLYHWSSPDGFVNVEYRGVERVRAQLRRTMRVDDV